MTRWKKFAAGALVLAGLAPHVHAQAIPAAPAAAPALAAPAAGAPLAGAAGAPAATPPSNLWSFFCMTPDQKAACQAKFCNCPLGQMLNNGLMPMSMVSGGLVPSLCPSTNPADLAKPADTPEGAAARAKADEAAAKARRDAVRFLGTVDCHYWPEAQEALVNALRGDRNECVRLEAAFSLNRGCCCTKLTIKGLVNCVSGTEEDGYPSERSERVLAAAHLALTHCLACYTEVVPVPPAKESKEPLPPRGEPIPPPLKGGPVPKSEAKPIAPPDHLPTNLGQVTPAEYYRRVQNESRQQLIAEGQRVLSRLQPATSIQLAKAEEHGPNGLLDIFEHAFSSDSATPPLATVIVPQPTPPVVTMKSITTTTTVVDATPKPISAPVPIPALAPAPAPVAVLAPAPAVVTAVRPPLTVYPPAPSVPGLYTSPATPPVQTVQMPIKAPAPRPAATTPADNGQNMTMAQVVAVLHDSPHVEYRQWAADNLATVDGWTNPQVVQALAQAVQKDQSPVVRAASVRALGHLRCSTMTALSAVQAAKIDTDPRVRKEADLALHLISNVDAVSLTVPSGH